MSIGLSIFIHLAPIHDIQSLPQGADALALEVVNGSLSLGKATGRRALLGNEGWGEAYPRRQRLTLPSERLIAVLNHYSVAAFRVGRDVDVEANDVACIDGLLVDDFVCLVGDGAEWRPYRYE